MLKQERHAAEELLLNITKTETILEFTANSFFKQFKITRAQFAALHQVIEAGAEGISLSGLSEKMLVTKANITTLADRMEAGGLIQRVSHNKDRRSILVIATEKGKQLAKKIVPERRKLASEIFECLSETEIELADKILVKIQGNLPVVLKEYM